MKIVLAGNYREFINYCQENGLDPHNKREVIYVSEDGKSLFGIRLGPKDQIVRYGTWYRRRYDQVINERLRFLQTLRGDFG